MTEAKEGTEWLLWCPDHGHFPHKSYFGTCKCGYQTNERPKKASGPTRLERDITQSILRWLRALGSCKTSKRPASVLTAGEADIFGCFDGVHFELEVKRPGKKATPRQLANLRKWSRAKALVAVVHSVDEVRALFIARFGAVRISEARAERQSAGKLTATRRAGEDG